MKKAFIFGVILFICSSIYSQGKFDGFGNIKWGSSINDVKGNVTGKLSYTDEKKIIISRDGDIEYLYGFLYKGESVEEPKDTNPNPPTTPGNNQESTKPAKSENNVKDSKLFYVSVKFPYLTKDEVKKKIEEKFGPSTGEDLKDNKGAIVWNSDNTTIIMWVDNYEKKPYCMKISYLSKEISKEVKDYQRLIFNTREIEVLKRLSL